MLPRPICAKEPSNPTDRGREGGVSVSSDLGPCSRATRARDGLSVGAYRESKPSPAGPSGRRSRRTGKPASGSARDVSRRPGMGRHVRLRRRRSCRASRRRAPVESSKVRRELGLTVRRGARPESPATPNPRRCRICDLAPSSTPTTVPCDRPPPPPRRSDLLRAYACCTGGEACRPEPRARTAASDDDARARPAPVRARPSRTEAGMVRRRRWSRTPQASTAGGVHRRQGAGSSNRTRRPPSTTSPDRTAMHARCTKRKGERRSCRSQHTSSPPADPAGRESRGVRARSVVRSDDGRTFAAVDADPAEDPTGAHSRRTTPPGGVGARRRPASRPTVVSCCPVAASAERCHAGRPSEDDDGVRVPVLRTSVRCSRGQHGAGARRRSTRRRARRCDMGPSS